MQNFWAEHLERLRASLIAQTDRARKGSKHTLIKGTSIEVVIRRTLSEYLPSAFHIGTGQIVNNKNQFSPQIDILVYDALSFPRLAVNEDKSVVICSESVHAVVECKSSWDSKTIINHFTKFVEVDSNRYCLFGTPGMHAGYFVLTIDSKRPKIKSFQFADRSIGFYTLKGKKSWASRYQNPYFTEIEGNSLDFFLNDIMYDCMRKGLTELGSLDHTYEAVRQYLGWAAMES